MKPALRTARIKRERLDELCERLAEWGANEHPQNLRSAISRFGADRRAPAPFGLNLIGRELTATQEHDPDDDILRSPVSRPVTKPKHLTDWRLNGGPDNWFLQMMKERETEIALIPPEQREAERLARLELHKDLVTEINGRLANETKDGTLPLLSAKRRTAKAS